MESKRNPAGTSRRGFCLGLFSLPLLADLLGRRAHLSAMLDNAPLMVKLHIMKPLFIMLLAAAPVAATAGEPPPEALLANQVDWAQLPRGEDFARVFPDYAMRSNVEGRTELVCRITQAQTLDNCRVLSQAPVGYAFGQAGLALSRYFKLKPQQTNPRAVEGASVLLKLRFNL